MRGKETIDNLIVELSKAQAKISELEKSSNALKNHLSQARLDVRAADGRAKEAEERANKLKEMLEAEWVA